MDSNVWGGWLDLGDMYLCESVGLVYRSVCILLSVICVRVSKKGTDWEGVETVNFTRGWQELRYVSSGTWASSSVRIVIMSSMYRLSHMGVMGRLGAILFSHR